MTTLDTLPVGHSAIIVSVGGEGALRRRLLDMGLIPRTVVYLKKIAPMGDPLSLCLRGYELTLRREDARTIQVNQIDSCRCKVDELVSSEHAHQPGCCHNHKAGNG